MSTAINILAGVLAVFALAKIVDEIDRRGYV